MKTERIEFVAPRGLKAKLQEEAKDLHISLDELIRGRLQFDDEERELALLTASLKEATTEAQRDWTFAVEEVNKLVAALRDQKCKRNHQIRLHI